MSNVVPESVRQGAPDERARTLGTILDSLLGFTGAAAGWVGLIDAQGRLTFPVRRGEFPDAWLTVQQARGDVWGFTVSDGPTLLNEMKPPAPFGPSAVRNLLSCMIEFEGSLRGHVVLANKPNGFTSYDSAILQGFAHLLASWLGPPSGQGQSPIEQPPMPWRRVLDGVGEGIVVLDESGTLIYVNAAWLDWTGFTVAQLVGKVAPFPFWVNHRELSQLGDLPNRLPVGARPFRRRDKSLFWCQIRTMPEQCGGRRLLVAFLQQVPIEAGAPSKGEQSFAPSISLHELPFGVALIDSGGQILWSNPVLARLLPGHLGKQSHFRDWFQPPGSVLLDRLFRDSSNTAAGQTGRLILQRPGCPLTALWLTIGLQEGIGFLFALTDASDGFHLHGDWEPNVHAGFVPPSSAWMPLLLHSTGQVSYWNDRWEKMTGLTVESDSRSELVLDWLFPRQRDRETIADWLHQPARRGGQAVLDVVTPTGSKPMLCTLLLAGATELAEGSGESKERHGENWLLLVGEPDLFAGDVKPTHGFMRQFARGLGVLLNQYLTLPIGLSEEALSRPDLPAQVGAWFQQILDSCQRSSHLIAALEDLSALTLGEVQPVSFVTLIREFLDELPPSEERDYELNVKLGDTEVPVKVNRRMIRTVLRHLFTNAAQALIGSDRRTIEVRLHADEETARCEIHDTGEGFPSEEWTRAPVPFQSTKGPFARDPAHAALEATGLGLTVCRHLIMLHQGRLELISNSGGGTTAAMILPRSGHLSSENAEASSGGEAVRVDQSASTTSSRHPAVPTPKPPQQM